MTTLETPASTLRVHTSYLTLDPDESSVRTALLDVHFMHTLIMSGWSKYETFPDEPVRANMAVLYAQSLSMPGMVRIVTQALVPAKWDLPPNLLRTPIIEKERKIPLTGGVEFELTTTPVRDKDGRRMAVAPKDHVAWGERALQKAGLDIHSLNASPVTKLRSQFKSLPPEQRRHQAAVFTLTTVTYRGIATIADPQKYERALLHGVGRARAYGCGLLQTRPFYNTPK